MTRVYIGLDPGKKGGMAAIHPEGVEVAPTPTVGDEISLAGVREWLWRWIVQYRPDQIVVGIEDVHSIYGTAAGANFSFGDAWGMLKGVAAGLGLPYVLVAPKEWQKIGHQGIPRMTKVGKDGKVKTDTKGMSRLAAERKFPHVNLRATERCKNVHDGMVDALLIADWLRVMNL